MFSPSWCFSKKKMIGIWYFVQMVHPLLLEGGFSESWGSIFNPFKFSLSSERLMIKIHKIGVLKCFFPIMISSGKSNRFLLIGLQWLPIHVQAILDHEQKGFGFFFDGTKVLFFSIRCDVFIMLQCWDDC